MSLMQKLRAMFGASKAANVLSVLYGLKSGMSGGSGFIGCGDDMPYGKAVSDGYKGQVWTYRCIKAIGEAVGSVEWKAYKPGKGGATGKPIEGHPFAALMNRPNPFLTRMEYFDAWATHMNLAGSHFSEVVYVNDLKKAGSKKLIPKYLFPLRPDWVTVKPDATNFIGGYVLDAKGHGNPITYLPEQVVWMKFFHPLDDYRGLAPITAARRTIEVENSAINWNKSIFDNSAVTSGILSVPDKNILPEDRHALREELESEFTRDNLHRPMVTWGGMEWKAIGMSQADMEFLQQRKLNKYETCAIFGVPAQIIGANEDPTYSNFSVALLAFWEGKIIPLLNWIETTMNTRFSSYFDDVIVKPDIASVPALRESFAQKVKMAATLSTMGWPINAINERLGLGFEPVEWGDTAYYPGTMVPADAIGEEPAQVGNEPAPKPTGDPATDPNAADGEDPQEDPNLQVDGSNGDNTRWSRKVN